MANNLTMGEPDVLNDIEFQPWKNLAYAIVLRAAEDYESALHAAYRQIRNKGKIEPLTVAKISDCERFFNSDWMYELTGDVVTGEEVMKAIKKRVAKWAEKRTVGTR